jgi:hypothetical protein
LGAEEPVSPPRDPPRNTLRLSREPSFSRNLALAYLLGSRFQPSTFVCIDIDQSFNQLIE